MHYYASFLASSFTSWAFSFTSSANSATTSADSSFCLEKFSFTLSTVSLNWSFKFSVCLETCSFRWEACSCKLIRISWVEALATSVNSAPFARAISPYYDSCSL